MSAPDEAVVDPVVDEPPTDQPPVDEPPAEPPIDQPPVDEPVINEGDPTPLDRALLEWLGFDPDDVAEWWTGRESWPSPLRVLVDDLALRGAETLDDLTEADRRRLRVADQVADVQEGHRRRFIAGLRRAGGFPRGHRHERRL